MSRWVFWSRELLTLRTRTLRRTCLVMCSVAFLGAAATPHPADDAKKVEGRAAEIPKAVLLQRNSTIRQPQEIPVGGLLKYGCSVNLGTDGYWLVHVWGDYADGHRANSLATHGWVRLAAIRPSQKRALDDCGRFMAEVEKRVQE
jgi:hypothetical protein